MVWRHALGDESEMVYHEKDRLFGVHLGASKDQKMLFLRLTSTDTYEVRYLMSDRPDGAFQAVLPRQKGHKYNVEHRDGTFYHSYQPRRQELPPGDRASIEPLTGELEGASAAPGRRALAGN